MLTEQRHEIILNLLSEKGSITVTELKDILNTSESTIRRDLNTLDEQGRLTKVFGGAVEKINGVSTTELSVSQKADVNTEEKKKIAMYAARLVVPNDFIYIDAGTTTEYLIDYLICQHTYDLLDYPLSLKEGERRYIKILGYYK